MLFRSRLDCRRSAGPFGFISRACGFRRVDLGSARRSRLLARDGAFRCRSIFFLRPGYAGNACGHRNRGGLDHGRCFFSALRAGSRFTQECSGSRCRRDPDRACAQPVRLRIPGRARIGRREARIPARVGTGFCGPAGGLLPARADARRCFHRSRRAGRRAGGLCLGPRDFRLVELPAPRPHFFTFHRDQKQWEP